VQAVQAIVPSDEDRELLGALCSALGLGDYAEVITFLLEDWQASQQSQTGGQILRKPTFQIEIYLHVIALALISQRPNSLGLKRMQLTSRMLKLFDLVFTQATILQLRRRQNFYQN